MTILFHHHMLEEQMRQHRLEIEALNREAWKWNIRKTGKAVYARGGLPMLLGLLGKWL